MKQLLARITGADERELLAEASLEDVIGRARELGRVCIFDHRDHWSASIELNTDNRNIKAEVRSAFNVHKRPADAVRDCIRQALGPDA